jgi:serine/threonine protein kinase
LNRANYLGEGNAGIVHRVFYDNKLRAFKYNRIGKYESLENELKIYQYLCHDSECSCHNNIIKLYAYYNSPVNKIIALILDLYVATELSAILNYPQDPDTSKTHRLMSRSNGNHSTDWDHLRGILKLPIDSARDLLITTLFNEILQGLFCLHGKGILHRDLQLKNILVKIGSVAITDFGISKFYKSYVTGVRQDEKWHLFQVDNRNFGSMLGDFIFTDDEIPFQLLIETEFPLKRMAKMSNTMLASIVFICHFMPSIFNYISAMYYTINSQDDAILFLNDTRFDRVSTLTLTSAPKMELIYQFITKIYDVKEINLFQFYLSILKKGYREEEEGEFDAYVEASILEENEVMAQNLRDHQFLDAFIAIFTV